MKKPSSSKLHCAYKSVSEEQLQRGGKPTVAAHGSKSGEKAKHLKRLKPKFSNKSETSINNTGDFELSATSSITQLIPTPKTPKQPRETLRRSLSKLKSSQWNEYVAALRDIVQISRFNPQLLEKSMPDIFKGVTKLLKSLSLLTTLLRLHRISVTRTACQAANELFMNIQSGQSPEFDELVHVLLQKAGDSNKQVQKDALEALNSMIIHVPPTQSIKTLLHRRIAGCSLSVRTTASKLLACVLDDSDEHPSATLNQDLKVRLVSAVIKFLRDDSYDIKYYGKRLLTTLLEHKDFESILQKKISADALHRVNKII